MDQNTSAISALNEDVKITNPKCLTSDSEHQRLDSLMQARFKEIIGAMTGRSMATGGGRTGRDVLSGYGSKRIKEEIEKFYRDFPEFGC